MVRGEGVVAPCRVRPNQSSYPPVLGSRFARMEVKMPELKLTLETVTPLFLGGANPRGQPELRPPAFRGAMRYWLRAVLGGGGLSLSELRDAESQVFGFADERGAGGSPLAVRITKEVEPKIDQFKRESRGRQVSGRDYLYWTAAATRRDPARSYIEEGYRFSLRLVTQPTQEPNEVFLPALASAWLMLHLGGVGSRSRRTAGSLAAVTEPKMKGLAWKLNGDSADEVARELGKGLRGIRNTLKLSTPLDLGVPSEYDILAPDACSIYVLGVWSTVAAAVEAAGGALRDFRAGNQLVDRAVFGLPIQKLDVTVGRDLVRRASPLWLKVSPTKSGYACIATIFRSRLFPDETVGPRDLPANHDLLSRFIAEQFPKRAEVHYG